MNQERWENLVNDIKDKFEVEDHGNKHLDEMGGTDIEFIVFKGPLGRIKLTYVTKPVVLDKKMNYSQRIGSETSIEYTYSENERTARLIAYKWDDNENDWVEIDADNFK